MILKFPYFMFLLWLAPGLFTLPGAASAQSAYDSSAVVFAYQRVGEALYPSNNISTEQFAGHVRELIEGGYHVRPLPEIIKALKSGTPIPDLTVAITFDGAYRSAYDNAMTLLLENNLPFTVFFSPNQSNGDNPQYIAWEELKRLAKKDQVTLGLHSASYMHLTGQPEAEIRRQVNSALTLFRNELKENPALFAYPFGEYNHTYRDVIAASGFDAGFGQNSGALYLEADPFALPRFTITEGYGGIDRFRLAARALPLPATDITPEDPSLSPGAMPDFGFSIPDTLAGQLSQLACFVSEQGKLDVGIVGKNRVEMRVKDAFEGNRIRFNCTMPGPVPKPGEEQRWRWFGMLLTQGKIEPDDTDIGAGLDTPPESE